MITFAAHALQGQDKAAIIGKKEKKKNEITKGRALLNGLTESEWKSELRFLRFP